MSHLKRHMVPKTWDVKRKESKFAVVPHPRAALIHSIPIAHVLRDILGFANTIRETRYYLNNNKVLINGRVVRDQKQSVCLMDVITINDDNYRVVISSRGKLTLETISLEEAKYRALKVVGFSLLKTGILQVNFSFGGTIRIAKDKIDSFRKEVSIDDTVILSENKMVGIIKLASGSQAFIYNGKKIGSTGTIEKDEDGHIVMKDKEGNEFMTLKSYVYAVPKSYGPKGFNALK